MGVEFLKFGAPNDKHERETLSFATRVEVLRREYVLRLNTYLNAS